MKKIMMTIAAVLCCAMTTEVFTACGDDDVTTPPAAGKYKYWVEINSLDNEVYDYTEAIAIQKVLNKAVGLNEYNVYEKTYNSRKDAEMKAACEAVLKQYTDTKSLYLSYVLMTNDGEFGKNVAVAQLVGGRSVYEPCAKISMGITHEAKEYKATCDSLLHLKTHADSLKVDEFKTEANARRNNIVDDFNNALKVLKNEKNEYKWWLDNENLASYNAAYFDGIAAPHLNDSLAYDVTITINKWSLPSNKTEQIWTHTFKKNYSYKE